MTKGLSPSKFCILKVGYNTCGLPFVRTSPDHGVGLDIAGKDQADAQSFTASVFQAIDRVRMHQQHAELTAHVLPKFEQKSRRDS